MASIDNYLNIIQNSSNASEVRGAIYNALQRVNNSIPVSSNTTSEVNEARVNASGTSYTSLKARLNADYNTLVSKINSDSTDGKRAKIEIDNATVGFSSLKDKLDDITEELAEYDPSTVHNRFQEIINARTDTRNYEWTDLKRRLDHDYQYMKEYTDQKSDAGQDAMLAITNATVGFSSLKDRLDGQFSQLSNRFNDFRGNINDAVATAKANAENAATRASNSATSAAESASSANSSKNSAQTAASNALSYKNSAEAAATSANNAKDTTLTARDVTLEARDVTLAARDVTLEAKDTTLAAKDVSVGARDTVVDTVNKVRSETYGDSLQIREFMDAIKSGSPNQILTRSNNGLDNKNFYMFRKFTSEVTLGNSAINQTVVSYSDITYGGKYILIFIEGPSNFSNTDKTKLLNSLTFELRDINSNETLIIFNGKDLVTHDDIAFITKYNDAVETTPVIYHDVYFSIPTEGTKNIVCGVPIGETNTNHSLDNLYLYDAENDRYTEEYIRPIQAPDKCYMAVVKPATNLGYSVTVRGVTIDKNEILKWVDNPPVDRTLSHYGQPADAKAVSDAIAVASSWKSLGTENQILSKTADGIAWIDNPPVDPSLSEEGKPADAKAVGDAIDEINDVIENTINDTIEELNQNIETSNTWKSEGTENQILSKSANGIEWVDNPPVDATLTHANEPADAKEVGDRFASHDSRITAAATNAANALTDTGVLNTTVAAQADDISEMQTQLDDMDTSLENFITDCKYNDIDSTYEFYHDDSLLFSVPAMGGGGGGSTSSVQMTSRLLTGWLSKNIRYGSSVDVTFEWSSLEDEIETGPGFATLECNGFSRTVNIEQGQNTVTYDADWFNIDKNRCVLTLFDSLGNRRQHNLTINAYEYLIQANLDNTNPFYSDVRFTYTLFGKGSMNVHFIMDDVEIGSTTTTVTNTALEYIIPQQLAGVHSFEVYVDGTIGGEPISSNELYYELMWLDQYSDRPLISVANKGGEVDQYTTIHCPIRAYSPTSEYTDVDVYVNDVLVQSLKDLSRHEVYDFAYMLEDFNNPEDASDVTQIKFTALNILEPKIVNFKVKESTIQINPVETGLDLYLTSKNRSNSEEHWDTWEYGDIHATFTGFNRKFDGWQTDADGFTVLRVSNDARVEIPYKPFDHSFTANGFTMEFDILTRDVLNYNTDLISCWSDNKGLKIQPTLIKVSTGKTVWSRFSDNEHLHIAYVFDYFDYNSNERLANLYINGIWSKTIRYTAAEQTFQTNPVNIVIGSNDATIDIYTIRVYNRMLTRREIVNNWLADMRDKTKMMQLYHDNQIYNDNNQVTPESLRSKLPIQIFTGVRLPESKEDKQLMVVEHIDDANPSRSFITVINATIAGQGTSSSAYVYKNFSIKFPKESIQMNGSSTPVSKFSLTPMSIPFNSFVDKADVASIEGANNVMGVDTYNEFCPYKPPEMEEDARVRWGIEGYPEALFYRDNADNSVSFRGKINFNLPKRAPAPFGYPDDDEQLALDDYRAIKESWEIELNNTPEAKFQAANFEGEDWKDTFECRIPDKYYDNRKIKELTEFIASTNRANATGEAFSSPITLTIDSLQPIKMYTPAEGKYSYTTTNNKYNVTFTHDTPCYRLTRFRALADEYMEMDTFCWYYDQAFILLNNDGYAKNLFIGFRGSRVREGGPVQHYYYKACAEPYDWDSLGGIDNAGALVLSPFLMDTDYVIQRIGESEYPRTDDPTQQKVFTGQDSVLQNNVRDVYWDRCRSVLAGAYSKGFNAEYIIQKWRNHQKAWCASLYNEDQYVKLITPLIEPLHEDPNTIDPETGKPVKMKTEEYLPKLLGDKASQFAWFIRNRFAFVFSWFTIGDAENVFIKFRINTAASITLWPVHDLFVGMRFGEGGANQVKRVFAGESATFTYNPDTAVTNFECRVFSGNKIRKIEGLNQAMANEIDVSRASKLEELIVGGDIVNNYLSTFDASSNPMLKVLNVRNCPNLTVEVNLEKSPIIETVLFGGSSITGVNLCEGCQIETLELPNTITKLILIDLPKLQNVTIAGYSNIDTFMFADVDTTIVNPFDVIELLKPNTAINIKIEMSVTDPQEVYDAYAIFDTMHGVYRTKVSGGGWRYEYEEEDPDNPGSRRLLKAQISGTIHMNAANGNDILAWQTAYPNVIIDAAHTSATLYYHYDNGDVWQTETIIDGGNGTLTNNLTREATAQYTFTPNGWATVQGGNANPQALINVTGDRHVYPAFDGTLRSYTVTFAKLPEDGGGTLETKTLDYGVMPTYTGPTPTTTKGGTDEYEWSGWTVPITPVSGNVTYYTSFRYISYLYTKILDGTLSGEYENNEVTKIGHYKLKHMEKLTRLSLPNVTKIGAQSITASGNSTSNNECSLNIPLVTTVGMSSINGIKGLHGQLSFPELVSIDSYVFSNIGTSNSNDPIILVLNKLTTYSTDSFRFAYIDKIIAPSITQVSNAFSTVYGLRYLEISNKVNYINQSIGKSYVEFTIPESVTTLSSFLANCTQLTTVKFMGKPSTLPSDMFSGCTSLSNVYVSWNENEVSGYPWGADESITSFHYINEGWKNEV